MSFIDIREATNKGVVNTALWHFDGRKLGELVDVVGEDVMAYIAGSHARLDVLLLGSAMSQIEKERLAVASWLTDSLKYMGEKSIQTWFMNMVLDEPRRQLCPALAIRKGEYMWCYLRVKQIHDQRLAESEVLLESMRETLLRSSEWHQHVWDRSENVFNGYAAAPVLARLQVLEPLVGQGVSRMIVSLRVTDQHISQDEMLQIVAKDPSADKRITFALWALTLMGNDVGPGLALHWLVGNLAGSPDVSSLHSIMMDDFDRVRYEVLVALTRDEMGG